MFLNLVELGEFLVAVRLMPQAEFLVVPQAEFLVVPQAELLMAASPQAEFQGAVRLA
jgi:hypothetical protein